MKNLFVMFVAFIAVFLLASCSAEKENFESIPETTSSAASNSESTAPETGNEETSANLKITVNGNTYELVLYENETAKAFSEKLPLDFSAEELNGNEKYFYLDFELPTEPSVPEKISRGDLMLYGENCLVLFYEDFVTAYSYTPIGYVTAPEGLFELSGTDSADISISY